MIVPDTIWQPDLSGAGRAKYKALAQAIRNAIASGSLAQGAKLPPVRDLAYRAGITPGTVARAYGILTDEGLLVAEVGRGTFVSGPARKTRKAETPLLHAVDEETADFRSSRVPDVGQGVIIDETLIRLAQSRRRPHISYPTAETDFDARQAVVDWIGQGRLGPIGADDVVLANGAQNGCILALQDILHGPQPVILAEELAYPGTRHAARLLRAKVVGVAMDEEGIIPEALVEAYRKHGGQVLITAAEVHSPTTVKTGYARKKAIAAVAERFGFSIIEDDCHTTGSTDVPCYRAILPRQSYYVSALTKSVSGALRFGYAVAPLDGGKSLRQVAQSSHYGVAQPIVDLCENLLTSGNAAQIRSDVIARTAGRVRSAVNKLGRWNIRWREDAPFVWLQLPTGWRASSFAMACAGKGVTIRPADEFALSTAMAPNAVRLAVNTCVSDMRYLQALDVMNDLLGNPDALVDG
ncbi:aminotransferase-like domain-containing protein [Yoonia sediminilitoris]|uniref:GntR family transcriptional regulator n=1 Tax=Yoonia sediminilitoris TaxID=1286148 RepID=A0A2T6KCP2_9RHOB|nr:PLP-dependent aminotransferase family protein [Yoonia sediminilitoris]PUB12717.1 GntR family transcriptional regulator [Yoonia sediminilitoris]RCW94196.1 GntR family transcriptional regulator [Yoonia sediminilitoris]